MKKIAFLTIALTLSWSSPFTSSYFVKKDFMSQDKNTFSMGTELESESKDVYALSDLKLVFYSDEDGAKLNSINYNGKEFAIFYEKESDLYVIYSNIEPFRFSQEKKDSYKEGAYISRVKEKENLVLFILDQNKNAFVNLRNVIDIKEDSFVPNLMFYENEKLVKLIDNDLIPAGIKKMCINFENKMYPNFFQVKIGDELKFKFSNAQFKLGNSKLEDEYKSSLIKVGDENCMNMFDLDLKNGSVFDFLIYVENNSKLELYNLTIRGRS